MPPRNIVLELAQRNVAEQAARIGRQQALIAGLRRDGRPTDTAEEALARMCSILDRLRDAVARLQPNPDATT
jgi:hypothetical protein